jgi:hypothetical protein
MPGQVRQEPVQLRPGARTPEEVQQIPAALEQLEFDLPAEPVQQLDPAGDP